MPVLVYCRPRDYALAGEAVAEMREQGVKAVIRNGAKFHPTQDIEPADRVVLVSDLPVVAEAYRARGVEVETDEPEIPEAPEDLPEPKASKPAPRGRRKA